MVLYDYFRSTACYRVRLALHIKNIAFECIEVHLINNEGEQHRPEYHKINPQHLVPSLKINDQIITQSLAIIDYLEDVYPKIPLLPVNPYIKASIKALALIVACDIHPINNLRVLNYLKEEFHANQEQITTWYHHWLKLGFDAFEIQLQGLERSKPVCFGATPTLADVCLIPQVYNAKRFDLDMTAYPLITEINDYCLTLPAFIKSQP